MSDRSLSIRYTEYTSWEELPKQVNQMLQGAKDAARNAYAPYSLFKVGVSLLMDDGQIIKGNNQENVAYPSGMCAERVALYYASSEYPGKIIKSLAIFSEPGNVTRVKPVTPCGACRQVIAEYEKKQQSPISIICSSNTGTVYVFSSIEDLLPFMFEADELIKE